MSKKKDKVDANSPFAKLAELKKKLQDEAKPAAPPPAPRPPAKPKSAAQRAAAQEEEELTFHRMMSGVTPLDPARAAPARERVNADDAVARERLRDLALGGSRFEVTDDGQRAEGHRDDVAPDVMRKLRRGMLPIDARLDMHGMRAEEAREALRAFVRDKRARGERCVLVIHGRGEHSAGPAVLRGEIAAWLSQGPASEHVAAFATARPEDGGEGAQYVLLRR